MDLWHFPTGPPGQRTVATDGQFEYFFHEFLEYLSDKNDEDIAFLIFPYYLNVYATNIVPGQAGGGSFQS